MNAPTKPVRARCRPAIRPWRHPRSACCWSISAPPKNGTDCKNTMWRYLREFLSDPRVIELPRTVWYPILYGAVLTTRPQKSGANYRRYWNTNATIRRCAPSRAARPRSWRWR